MQGGCRRQRHSARAQPHGVTDRIGSIGAATLSRLDQCHEKKEEECKLMKGSVTKTGGRREMEKQRFSTVKQTSVPKNTGVPCYPGEKETYRRTSDKSATGLLELTKLVEKQGSLQA